MRVLAVNTMEEKGGAARAALRLSIGLRYQGIDLAMSVRQRDSDRFWVKKERSKLEMISNRAGRVIDSLPNIVYPRRSSAMWSNNSLPTAGIRASDLNEYDLLHLHWIGSGFLPIRTLARTTAPIVWTMHDMWAFTGGCHYSGDCELYEQQCGDCPDLRNAWRYDLSHANWRRKRRAYRDKNLHIVTPSRWLGAMARRSSLLEKVEVSVIPNGLDLKIYRPIGSKIARGILGLPQGKKIILFGGSINDDRKGFSLLSASLAQLAENNALADDYLLVVFGASEPRQMPKISVATRFLGSLGDEISLCLLYSAADIIAVPSRQENLANTIVEAMACATPAIAFDLGGNPDLIDHMKTGYLVKPFYTEELAHGIAWLLSDGDRLRVIGENARKKCEETYAIDVVCERYIELYRRMIDASGLHDRQA